MISLYWYWNIPVTNSLLYLLTMDRDNSEYKIVSFIYHNR